MDVPEGGRAQVEFLSLDAPYGFSRGEVRDRFGAMCCPPTIVSISRSNAPIRARFCSSTTDGIRARNCISARRSIPPATPRFRWKCVRPDVADNQHLSHYAFVVLDDLGIDSARASKTR